MDVLDLNGSFMRNLRKIVGRNPVLLIGTKIDLLPPKTNLEKVHDWLRFALLKKRLQVINVKLVSNETQGGIKAAMNAILEARKGMDVFVVGAANAGKSNFIANLLNFLEVKFPEGKVEDCARPMISRTPGTTLGTIPLRAFRRSPTSPVFSSLYDTPGMHQPYSMQNLLDVHTYNMVQPTRKFGVRSFRPAKDIVAEMKKKGIQLTADSTTEWLKKPIRYLWGFPNQPPVAVIEVVPPVSPMLQISLVGVQNLAITCEAGIENSTVEGRTGVLPKPPEGLVLNHVAYVNTPEELTTDGEVVADIALSGFGWVAVCYSALSEKAAGRQMARSKMMIRVYGPKKLKVKQSKFPMPVGGLPGVVHPPPEVEDLGDEDRDDDDDDEPAERSRAHGDDRDVLDEDQKSIVVPPQPWLEGLTQTVGGFEQVKLGGGKTGDTDDAAADEAAGDTLRRPKQLLEEPEDFEKKLEKSLEEDDGLGPMNFKLPKDDGLLPMDHMDEGWRLPSPEGWGFPGAQQQDGIPDAAFGEGLEAEEDLWGGQWPGVPGGNVSTLPMNSGNSVNSASSSRAPRFAQDFSEEARREDGRDSFWEDGDKGKGKGKGGGKGRDRDTGRERGRFRSNDPMANDSGSPNEGQDDQGVVWQRYSYDEKGEFRTENQSTRRSSRSNNRRANGNSNGKGGNFNASPTVAVKESPPRTSSAAPVTNRGGGSALTRSVRK
eukprot:TRINITY_DN10671_c0_g1_i3.p1 TRINITY_DN10671_c0_g1~~TRINITY_DN10671_c0_g1_i3.p1  ORF type:complete len:734 (-),score=157.40 TRINITY_DN10671_c0_g1_i3:98-2239(-)